MTTQIYTKWVVDNRDLAEYLGVEPIFYTKHFEETKKERMVFCGWDKDAVEKKFPPASIESHHSESVIVRLFYRYMTYTWPHNWFQGDVYEDINLQDILTGPVEKHLVGGKGVYVPIYDFGQENLAEYIYEGFRDRLTDCKKIFIRLDAGTPKDAADYDSQGYDNSMEGVSKFLQQLHSSERGRTFIGYSDYLDDFVRYVYVTKWVDLNNAKEYRVVINEKGSLCIDCRQDEYDESEKKIIEEYVAEVWDDLPYETQFVMDVAVTDKTPVGIIEFNCYELATVNDPDVYHEFLKNRGENN